MGYAFTDSGKVEVHQSGVWDLKPRRHEGGGMRYLRVRRNLEALLVSEQIGDRSAVFYEEVRGHKGTDAAHIYGGIVATIASVCEELGVPYQGIPVGTIKKRATGKGNASKHSMVRAAHHEWMIDGFEGLISEDEADAMWVLQCGLDELGYEGSPAPEPDPSE